MSIPVVLLIVLAVALIIVYAYRRVVAGSTDELVHLSDVSDMAIAKQAATDQKLRQLDRLVITIAVVFVIYGLALGGFQIYTALVSPSPGS
jgi:uncharacterized membrane protein